jgi:hypothetical protein
MSTATMARPLNKTKDFAEDPHLDTRVKEFLKLLNSND